MDVITLILGAFFGFIATFLLGSGIFLFWWMNETKYRYYVIQKNFTQGSMVVKVYKARKTMLPELGEVYELKTHKGSTDRFVPVFGTSAEVPVQGSTIQKTAVFVAYRDGVHTPMADYPFQTEKRKVIKYEPLLDPKTGEPLKDENGNFIVNKKKPKVVEEEALVFVTKPLKQSMRHFAIYADGQLNKEFAEAKGWWDKYGAMVMFGFIVMAGVVISVLMMVFSQQHAETLASMAPFADQVAARTAEMLANTTATGGLPLAP